MKNINKISEVEILNGIKKLCDLAGINYATFISEMEVILKNRVRALLTPNNNWFKEGKILERYWKHLESITKHEWKYEDVTHWYKFLRNPSETREEIPLQ